MRNATQVPASARPVRWRWWAARVLARLGSAVATRHLRAGFAILGWIPEQRVRTWINDRPSGAVRLAVHVDGYPDFRVRLVQCGGSP